MTSNAYVVIGASAASIAFMNKIARLDSQAHIICISQEKELPYNKCFLADYCAGLKVEQEVLINTAFVNNRVTWLFNTQVTHINVTDKSINTADGQTITYGILFLGMGSSPFIPSFAVNNTNIYTFHTLNDTNRLLAQVRAGACKKAIIIGAGLSGVECADALHKNRVQVTLIEQKSTILPSILDEDSAVFLQEHIAAQGITILTNQTVTSIDEAAKQVCLSDKSCLEADAVVVATGLRANTYVTRNTGIKQGPLGGILVDERMQTSVKGVFAGGDLIEITNILSGQATLSCTWPDAMFQGMMAAQAAFGQPTQPYKGAPIIVNSAFFGLNFAQAGLLGAKVQRIVKKGSDFYQSYVVENNQLKGFIVLGNTHDFGMLKRLILTGQSVKGIAE